MGIDPEKVNPQGGAIALGHPLGVTGAVLTLTCAYALRRAGKRSTLVPPDDEGRELVVS